MGVRLLTRRPCREAKCQGWVVGKLTQNFSFCWGGQVEGFHHEGPCQTYPWSVQCCPSVEVATPKPSPYETSVTR